jgi:polo-like kinase 1
MIVGRPPFETENIKTTYHKIKTNDYRFPSSTLVSEDAKSLIKLMLCGDPKLRPSLEDIRSHPFMSRGFMPSSLPVSALLTVRNVYNSILSSIFILCFG